MEGYPFEEAQTTSLGPEQDTELLSWLSDADVASLKVSDADPLAWPSGDSGDEVESPFDVDSEVQIPHEFVIDEPPVGAHQDAQQPLAEAPSSTAGEEPRCETSAESGDLEAPIQTVSPAAVPDLSPIPEAEVPACLALSNSTGGSTQTLRERAPKNKGGLTGRISQIAGHRSELSGVESVCETVVVQGTHLSALVEHKCPNMAAVLTKLRKDQPKFKTLCEEFQTGFHSKQGPELHLHITNFVQRMKEFSMDDEQSAAAALLEATHKLRQSLDGRSGSAGENASHTVAFVNRYIEMPPDKLGEFITQSSQGNLLSSCNDVDNAKQPGIAMLAQYFDNPDFADVWDDFFIAWITHLQNISSQSHTSVMAAAEDNFRLKKHNPECHQRVVEGPDGSPQLQSLALLWTAEKAAYEHLMDLDRLSDLKIQITLHERAEYFIRRMHKIARDVLFEEVIKHKLQSVATVRVVKTRSGHFVSLIQDWSQMLELMVATQKQYSQHQRNIKIPEGTCQYYAQHGNCKFGDKFCHNGKHVRNGSGTGQGGNDQSSAGAEGEGSQSERNRKRREKRKLRRKQAEQAEQGGEQSSERQRQNTNGNDQASNTSSEQQEKKDFHGRPRQVDNAQLTCCGIPSHKTCSASFNTDKNH